MLVAAALVPGAALTASSRYFIPGCCLVLGVVIVALADAALSSGLGASVGVSAPALVRMWKDRDSAIDLAIHNLGQRVRSIRLALVLPEEIASLNEELPVDLPAGAEFVRVSWPCTPAMRGRYTVDRCAAEFTSILGLWAVRRTLLLAAEIRVYPDISTGQKSASFRSRGITGSRPQRQIGRGREFEKLRDYASGDSFDEIDWKATARRGKPITRVFQVERTQEVYVILDASRLLARRVSSTEKDSLLERNVTAALLLAIQAQKQGDLFGLVTFSDRVHGFVRARNGKAHYAACRDALYTLQPRIVTPDFDEVCTLLRLRLRRRALLVFLTELDDPAMAESFVRNVSLLRRQHLVIAGMLRPANARPVFGGHPVSEIDDVYASLAGHQQWHKLRELGIVLERQGVRFLMFEPPTLASELTSAYVSLKQRQVL